MIWAVIGDVHANLEALEAVMEDSKKHGARGTIDLGDRAGYGPSVNEVLTRMSDIPGVVGNHDETICSLDTQPLQRIHPNTQAIWMHQYFEILEKDRLKQLPRTLTRDSPITGAKLVFAHASLNQGFPYIKLKPKDSQDVSAESQFLQMGIGDILFIAHSHKPMLFYNYFGMEDGELTRKHLQWQGTHANPYITCHQINGSHDRTQSESIMMPTELKTIVNAGSVGQPRDGDPRACYVLYNTDLDRIIFRRVPYNITQTCTKIQKMRLKQELKDALCRRLTKAM